jgi:hypothetical protein
LIFDVSSCIDYMIDEQYSCRYAIAQYGESPSSNTMKSFFNELNWILYSFNKLVRLVLVAYLKVFLIAALFFVVCIGPAFLFWEHEELVTLWVGAVFLSSIFGKIFYDIYREQEEPEVIETDDGITFINEPKLPPRSERVRIALRHTWYWFTFGIVIILYVSFLINRYDL